MLADAASVQGEILSESPRRFGHVLGRFPVALEHVDESIASARTAFSAWSQRPISARSDALHRLRDVLFERREALAMAIAEEVGKPLWEARGEVQAAVAKIDVTLEDGLRLVQAVQVEPERARYAYRPHGVCAILGPFNFPLHLTHGHVVAALATGNTVVVKPSELTPRVGEMYAEAMDAAGLPAGVFNLVQGGSDIGARLSAHAGVDAVMFTGSYGVGQAIRQACFDQPGKLLALEMGGRNPAIILADAPLEKAVHDVLWGAFVTAGQRCSGTAVAYVESSCFDQVRARLLECAASLRVGDPLEEDVFMGPLISAAARDRFEASLVQAETAGAEPWLSTTRTSLGDQGAYVSPSVHFVERRNGANLSAYLHEELFGPDLAIERVDNLEAAIERANDSPYGLSASVFTADSSRFEFALPRLRYGCVNWNAPTCGASARLPFGGLKRSGNQRPAALFSTLYSTYAVATLVGASTLNTESLSPGMCWPDNP